MFYADTGASLGHVRASGACQGLHPSESQRRVLCQHARQARLTTQDREVHSNTRQDTNGHEMWQLLDMKCGNCCDIPQREMLASNCSGPVDDLYPAALLPAASEQQPLN